MLTSSTRTDYDAIWVIVDRLTKSAHFLVIRNNFSLNRLAKLYINEIIKLHGILVSIVSDRDSRFTSWFWPKLQKALGTTLHFSTTFHPHTDGNLKGPFRLWKIWYEHVFWSLSIVGRITCHWSNLIITIAIRSVLAWLLMRPCMWENVKHCYVGTRLVNGSWMM